MSKRPTSHGRPKYQPKKPKGHTGDVLLAATVVGGLLATGVGLAVYHETHQGFKYEAPSFGAGQGKGEKIDPVATGLKAPEAVRQAGKAVVYIYTQNKIHHTPGNGLRVKNPSLTSQVVVTQEIVGNTHTPEDCGDAVVYNQDHTGGSPDSRTQPVDSPDGSALMGLKIGISNLKSAQVAARIATVLPISGHTYFAEGYTDPDNSYAQTAHTSKSLTGIGELTTGGYEVFVSKDDGSNATDELVGEPIFNTSGAAVGLIRGSAHNYTASEASFLLNVGLPSGDYELTYATPLVNDSKDPQSVPQLINDVNAVPNCNSRYTEDYPVFK